MNEIRKISEKTILTALVNYKFVGMFGKCMAHLNSKEREYVIGLFYSQNTVLYHASVKF